MTYLRTSVLPSIGCAAAYRASQVATQMVQARAVRVEAQPTDAASHGCSALEPFLPLLVHCVALPGSAAAGRCLRMLQHSTSSLDERSQTENSAAHQQPVGLTRVLLWTVVRGLLCALPVFLLAAGTSMMVKTAR